MKLKSMRRILAPVRWLWMKYVYTIVPNLGPFIMIILIAAGLIFTALITVLNPWVFLLWPIIILILFGLIKLFIDMVEYREDTDMESFRHMNYWEFMRAIDYEEDMKYLRKENKRLRMLLDITVL